MSGLKGTLKEINWVITWQYDCLNRECPICRTSIENNKPVLIGACGHAFHHDCLNNWFKQVNTPNKKCPVCNKNWT